MEKNYYDILEINKNASQEIIDKAYKVLVKKYHPDLQDSMEEKTKCEEKIKEINEAFDILSNPQKREEYDKKIINFQVSREDYNNLYNENQNLKKELNNLKENYNNINHSSNQNNSNNINNSYEKNNNNKEYTNSANSQQNKNYQKQYNDAINKAYHDAYIKDLKNRGYKIKYKKTFTDYLRSIVALLITIGIIFIIIQIPFVKNYFYNLYIENNVIRFLVDTILSLFK